MLLQYLIVVILVIVATYLFCLVYQFFSGLSGPSTIYDGENFIYSNGLDNESKFSIWKPYLFLKCSLIVGITIFIGSIFRILQFRAGGGYIARNLGGVLLKEGGSSSEGTSINSNQLINIVEEMAIASSVAAPPVYLLQKEDSINAFAAGHNTGDAVIGVTSGALEHLSREELQSVVAHLFSHILNGDMRLYLKMTGLLFGISSFYLLGKKFLDLGVKYSSGEIKAGGVLIVLGFSLCVFGCFGALCARVLKFAVCRQREFLADSAAIEFTRNQEGIIGALKQTIHRGSQLNLHRAREFSHMFFSDPTPNSFTQNIFSTHPPLKERISSISQS